LYWHFVYFDLIMSITYERLDHFNTSYYGMGEVEDGDIWGVSATLPAICRRNGAARRQTRGSRVVGMHVLANWRPERSPFRLPSGIRVCRTETHVSSYCTKGRVQLIRCTDAQFNPLTNAHRNPIHPAFRGQTPFYEL